MVSEDPTEEEVKSLLDSVLPCWEWVFADWKDGDIMGRHMDGQPQEAVQEWINDSADMRNLDTNYEQVNQRLKLIGAVIRFTDGAVRNPALLPPLVGLVRNRPAPQ